MKISCKKWKTSVFTEKDIGSNRWYLVAEDIYSGEELAKEFITYCPFCGSKLNEQGCTKMNVPYKEIIDYLNKKADSRYKHTTKKYRKSIRARWKEGMALEDFKTVVDKKVAEWKGTDMEKWLRPQTLFSNKMDWYLNQEETCEKKKENKKKKKDLEDLYKRGYQ